MTQFKVTLFIETNNSIDESRKDLTRYYGLHRKDFRMNNTEVHVTNCDVELLT